METRDKEMTPLIFISIILLKAIGDGLYDEGRKTISHLFRAVMLLLLLLLPFVVGDVSPVWYVVAFVSLNIALFDWAYNLTRGLSVFYIGTTSLWDKFLQKINPGVHQIYGRIVFLILGIAISLKYL